MRRPLATFCLATALLSAGCQAPVGLLPHGAVTAPVGTATLTFAIAWPRTVQTIPLSAQSLRVEVLKGANVVATWSQYRSGQTPSAQGLLTFNADSGLTIRAEAFDVRTPSTSSVPVAAAELDGVTLHPNERRSLSLSLIPSFIPQITSVSPTNGGPGVTVTLHGQFGAVGPYAAFLGTFPLAVDVLDVQTLRTAIPDQASTAAWIAEANGVSSPATLSFQVLQRLAPSPAQATVSVGQGVAFSVPSGIDTSGATVSFPTITQWALVDPATQGTTSVGSLSSTGQFQALAAGTAILQVYSGTLMATAAIQVQ